MISKLTNEEITALWKRVIAYGDSSLIAFFNDIRENKEKGYMKEYAFYDLMQLLDKLEAYEYKIKTLEDKLKEIQNEKICNYLKK